MIWTGPLLACLPACTRQRDSEMVNVTALTLYMPLYGVRAVTFTPSADGGYRRVGWFACGVRGFDGQVREAAVEPAG